MLTGVAHGVLPHQGVQATRAGRFVTIARDGKGAAGARPQRPPVRPEETIIVSGAVDESAVPVPVLPGDIVVVPMVDDVVDDPDEAGRSVDQIGHVGNVVGGASFHHNGS
jgi:hypothetical protein